MGEERADAPPDALDTRELFALLSKAAALDVLYAVLVAEEPRLRFNQIRASTDVAPNTLSRRLEELVEADLLERRSYDEIPPRVEYEPTERLYALRPMFEGLSEWMARYGAEELPLPEERE